MLLYIICDPLQSWKKRWFTLSRTDPVSLLARTLELSHLKVSCSALFVLTVQSNSVEYVHFANV